MKCSLSTSVLTADLQPGKPPLRVETTGDAAHCAAEHPQAPRASVAEHGSPTLEVTGGWRQLSARRLHVHGEMLFI